MLGLPQNCLLEFFDVLIYIKYGQSCFCKQTANKMINATSKMGNFPSQPNMEQLLYGC